MWVLPTPFTNYMLCVPDDSMISLLPTLTPPNPSLPTSHVPPPTAFASLCCTFMKNWVGALSTIPREHPGVNTLVLAYRCSLYICISIYRLSAVRCVLCCMDLGHRCMDSRVPSVPVSMGIRHVVDRRRATPAHTRQQYFNAVDSTNVEGACTGTRAA